MSETMTKREQIAAMMMAALVARCGNASAGRLAWDATNYADALIVELKCSDGIKYELTPSQVEKMISDTIPGGDIADPQEIADAIREWFGYSSDDLNETPTSEDSSSVEADKDGWIFQQNVKSGGTERMRQNQKRDVVEVASRDLLSVLEILNAFDYEADEDSCMGMSFFTGRISEDGFFITKRRLEAALKAHQDSLANAQGQTRRKDGWIPHKPGNPMPCEGGSRNRIRLRNGVVTTTIYPEDFEWGEIPYHTDEEIIAWNPVD